MSLPAGAQISDPNFSVNIDTGEVKKMEGSQSQNSPHALGRRLGHSMTRREHQHLQSDPRPGEVHDGHLHRNFTTPGSNRFTIDQTPAWLKNETPPGPRARTPFPQPTPPASPSRSRQRHQPRQGQQVITKKVGGKCSAEFAAHAFNFQKKGRFQTISTTRAHKSSSPHRCDHGRVAQSLALAAQDAVRVATTCSLPTRSREDYRLPSAVVRRPCSGAASAGGQPSALR